jgi:hypothetical protein
LLAALIAVAFFAASSSPGSPAAASPGISTPAPSPTSYKPLPIPTPGATPWSPLSLAGVSLADTADEVRARLGAPFITNEKPEVLVWTYPMDLNHVALNVFLRHARVVGLTVSLSGGAKHSLLVDPFGLHLGEGIDTLLSIRGQPTKMVENRNVFAAGPGFEWEYQFDHGIAASIALNAVVGLPGPLPSSIPGPPGHDGTSLDKAIKFKGVTSALAQLTEYVYLAQPCDGKGTWTPTDHSVMSNPTSGMYIDVQSLVCSTTQRAAKLYFDRSRLPPR